MENGRLISNEREYDELKKLYDECLCYLKDSNAENDSENNESDDYAIVEKDEIVAELNEEPKFKIENEKSIEGINSLENKSNRLRKLSQQLPKIIITKSNGSLNVSRHDDVNIKRPVVPPRVVKKKENDLNSNFRNPPSLRNMTAYGDYPKRLVSKSGMENVALISNVPFGNIRLLNDTFHTLINLRWRWIVIATVLVHFTLWLVFAVFLYITALAHYDFEPDPPKKSCITGGKDFVTIFLASVEAQTTIGFGDRAIDEECPESIFLFIMQLILGTGLSGVLTCVVYAKLTRPEKLSRDGVGFSKNAVISMRDGNLCLMMRVWDLNYDHIISSEYTAHFLTTYRSAEGETVRQYARQLALRRRPLALWPLTLEHVIDNTSPLYAYTPRHFATHSYEIILSIKGASASMGTFTQSQTSYFPREVLWGHRFPPVVKYECRSHQYVVELGRLHVTEPVSTPQCSAMELQRTNVEESEPVKCPGTPGSFREQVSTFHVGRSSSFRKSAKL